MLNSYKLLSLRADLRYEKISFYKKYNAAGEYCEVLARQAKELLAARDNINAVVDSLAEPYGKPTQGVNHEQQGAPNKDKDFALFRQNENQRH